MGKEGRKLVLKYYNKEMLGNKLEKIYYKALDIWSCRNTDILSDKDDNKLLELAETSEAYLFITGNSTAFTLSRHLWGDGTGIPFL